MNPSKLTDFLLRVFEDDSLFGFSGSVIDGNNRCVLVTLLPYPDLNYIYSPEEYFVMLEGLWEKHSEKMNQIKAFLEENGISYAIPSASSHDDGNYFAEFSYKWAAIHAGLGFIGKNDVFVHHKYAQKVRISCLLIDIDMPVFGDEVVSKCGDCNLCVRACPYGFITGLTWHINVQRNELVDYRKCALKRSIVEQRKSMHVVSVLWHASILIMKSNKAMVTNFSEKL